MVSSTRACRRVAHKPADVIASCDQLVDAGALYVFGQSSTAAVWHKSMNDVDIDVQALAAFSSHDAMSFAALIGGGGTERD